MIGIVGNYAISRDWEAVLPGLGTTLTRRISIVIHMHCGAVAMLLGPFLFIARLRRTSPLWHRVIGRVYVGCAYVAVGAGLVFIAAKQRLVGGWSMSGSFALAGVAIFVSTTFVWYYAYKRDFVRTREWAVRSYCQILGPFLYRYWYSLAALGGYASPRPYKNGEADGERCEWSDPMQPTCDAYSRVLDSIHAWTYWLSAALFAELLVCAIRAAEAESGVSLSKVGSDADPSSPLEQSLVLGAKRTYGEPAETAEPTADAREMREVAETPLSQAALQPSRSAYLLNGISVGLAILATVVTVAFYAIN